MAAGAAIGNGTGSTIAFGTTTTFEPLVTGISGSFGSRPVMNLSHMLTTGYAPQILGEIWVGGSITVDVLLNYAAANTWPPVTAVAETITIHLGSASGPSIAFSGGIIAADFDAPLEGECTGSIEIQILSAPTLAAT